MAGLVKEVFNGLCGVPDAVLQHAAQYAWTMVQGQLQECSTIAPSFLSDLEQILVKLNSLLTKKKIENSAKDTAEQILPFLLFVLKNKEQFIQHLKKDVPQKEKFFQALNELSGLLALFYAPTFSLPPPRASDLSAVVQQTLGLIKDEIKLQEGTIIQSTKKTIQTAIDTLSRIVFPSSSTKFNFPSHPLIKLMRLIKEYQTYPDDSLPSQQNLKLLEAIQEVEEYSDLFQGLSATIFSSQSSASTSAGEYVPSTITPLITIDLNGLIKKISQFIVTKIGNAPNFNAIYKEVQESTFDIKKKHTQESSASQSEKGKERGKEISTLTNDQSNEVLWKAAAQHDNQQKITALKKRLQELPLNTPAHFLQALNLAIELLERCESISKELSKKEACTILQNMRACLDHIYLHIFSNYDITREQQEKFNLITTTTLQNFSTKDPLEALKEFKRELETSPMGKEIEKAFPYPASRLSEMENIPSLPPSDPAAKVNWEMQIDTQRIALVHNLTWKGTFQTVYVWLCGAPPPQPGGRDTETKAIERAYQEIFTRADTGLLPGGNGSKDAFIAALKEAIEQREDIAFFRKRITQASIEFIYDAIHYYTKLFSTSIIRSLKEALHSPSRDPSSTVHLVPITRINNCIIAHQNAMKEWAKSRASMGQEETLSRILIQADCNRGYEASDLTKIFATVVINKFLNLPTTCADKLRDIRTTITLNARADIIENVPENFIGKAIAELINFTGKGVTTIFSIFPHTLVGTVQVILFLFTIIFTFLLRTLAKFAFVYFNLANHILTATEGAYKQANNLDALNEIVLEKLIEIESQLGTNRNKQDSTELTTDPRTKRVFAEMIKNLFEVIEESQCLTIKEIQEILNSQDSKAIKLLKDTLTNASAHLLETGYQYLLQEDKMNELLCQLLEKANANLRPTGQIHNLFSARELREQLPTSTDADLKRIYADQLGKPEASITDEMIEKALVKKYQETHDKIEKEVIPRIVAKSVHEIICEIIDPYCIDPNDAALHLIDWYDKNLIGAQSRLATLHISLNSLPEEGRVDVLRALHADYLSLIGEFKKRQTLVDQTVTDQKMISILRRLNDLSNTEILPHLDALKTKLEREIQQCNGENVSPLEGSSSSEPNPPPHHLSHLRHTIKRIRNEIVSSSNGNKSIQDRVQELLQNAVRSILLGVTPIGEDLISRQVRKLAIEAFSLSQNSYTPGALFRHVIMLPLVEANGYDRSRLIKA